MGLDMYFEGTFSTRAFTERDPKNYAIDPDFESALESIGLKTLQQSFLIGIIIQLISLLLIGGKLIVSTTGLLKTFKMVTITASVVTLVMKR